MIESLLSAMVNLLQDSVYDRLKVAEGLFGGSVPSLWGRYQSRERGSRLAKRRWAGTFEIEVNDEATDENINAT